MEFISQQAVFAENTELISFVLKINLAKSIFLYRYFPPEKCDVSVDLSALALL